MYKHGTYAKLVSTIDNTVSTVDTVLVSVGTMPVHLVRNHADYVNKPVMITNANDARNKMGYIDDDTFTLNEVVNYHFFNAIENVSPVYFINVFDPTKVKKSTQTTVTKTPTNGTIIIPTTTAIMDTLAIADKVEGVDYDLSYDHANKTIVITFLKNVTSSVNITFFEVTSSTVTKTEIIGTVGADGTKTGLHALDYVYSTYNKIPGIITAPKWSSTPDVYKAMLSASRQISTAFDAYVLADIDTSTTKTVTAAINWKKTNGYTSEFSNVYFPKAIAADGRKYHLSTIAAYKMLAVDAENDGVPFESASNKTVDIIKLTTDDSDIYIDRNNANELNESGINTAIYWNGTWRLWGGHTASYNYYTSTDKRDIFDTSIRMMQYIMNMFHLDYADVIDRPMTVSQKDTIVNDEQARLDSLVAQGALIGAPTVAFIGQETDNYVNGDFTWSIQATPTPQLKSATLHVAYSTDGMSVYSVGGAE